MESYYRSTGSGRIILVRGALAVFVLVMCLADVAWIRLNVAPPRMFDDTLFLTGSLTLYHTLQEQGWGPFLLACTLPAREWYAPMTQILPVPFYFLWGPGTNTALYGFLLLIPVFCVYVFLLGKALLGDEKTALLSVLVTCLFPLTYGMWRAAMTDFGLA